MLVVVHHGDIEIFLQTLLDIETFRRLDILQVDAAESRCDALYGLAELDRIFFCHFDIEHIDAAVDLEEQSLAFHDGLSAHCTDIAESQHGGAIGNDGNEIAFISVLKDVVGRLLYLETRIGHTRGIGQAKVGLRSVRFGRLYFYFAGPFALMIFEGSFFCYLDHTNSINVYTQSIEQS
ncbi:uncharacterized protein BN812_00838 [Prevotella sp. CAG:924]|nr:uncharacterized protein BN812_00838 [Prevotella sp. CAG:924]